MLDIFYTSQFKRDYKKAGERFSQIKKGAISFAMPT
ncbi:hypothetical protein IGK15_000490 [Enterococcus sp. AZ045]